MDDGSVVASPLDILWEKVVTGKASVIVSYQDPKEYSAGARGTANDLLVMMAGGPQKRDAVGMHHWGSGLAPQVKERAKATETKVARVDSVGHTGSGLTKDDGWTLDPKAAAEMAPYLSEGAVIVAHGCGHPTKLGTGLDNMANFLKELPSGATVYTHDIPSGPGMPINFVRSTLVQGENGQSELSVKALAGSDRLVGVLFSEAYVRSWARHLSKQRLNEYLKGDEAYDKWAAKPENAQRKAPNQIRITDDVRKIMEEVASEKPKRHK